MKFTKMQGCGNDYVYINCLTEWVEEPEKLAVWVSDRRFGIGSDGLILIKPSKKADFLMEIYNADGAAAKMCGNGIRCVGKYVYDNKLTDKTSLVIDTLSGLRYLTLTVENELVKEVTVDMGNPILSPKLIPAVSDKEKIIMEPLKICEKEFAVTCVSVGNPHAIVYVEQVKDFAIEQYGPVFEQHEMFPEQVNTEFVEVISRTELSMRVWERGSGETFACGTGATACAYASMLNGFTDQEVLVHMLGGDLKIRYDEKENKLYMTGPAVTTFEGEFGVTL